MNSKLTLMEIIKEGSGCWRELEPYVYVRVRRGHLIRFQTKTSHIRDTILHIMNVGAIHAPSGESLPGQPVLASTTGTRMAFEHLASGMGSGLVYGVEPGDTYFGAPMLIDTDMRDNLLRFTFVGEDSENIFINNIILEMWP